MNPFVLDAFPFGYGEDVLLIRLRELADVVDLHLIVEADRWHGGQPRSPLWPVLERRPEFAPFRDRVVYHYLRTPGQIENPWHREEWLRDQVLDLARQQLITTPNRSVRDYVLFGDHDEIPHVNAIAEAVGSGLDFARLWTRYHEWFLNLRAGGSPAYLWEFRQPLLFRAGRVGQDGRHVRAQQFFGTAVEFGKQPDSTVDGMTGWHLTLQGGPDAVFDKLQVCAHTELRKLTREDVRAKLDARADLLLRCPLHWAPETEWPFTVRADADYWTERGYLG